MEQELIQTISKWLESKNLDLTKLTKDNIKKLCLESWQAGYKYGHNEGYGDGWEDAKDAYY